MQLQLPLWRPQAARDAAHAVRAGLLPRRAPGGWHSRDAAVMGTAIHVELWADRRADAEAAIDAVMAEMHRIDLTYSPHKPDSELSRINRDAGRSAVPVSEETYALLARAQAFAELSGGAFDISYAAVGRLYDYRRGIAPDDATLAAARSLVGWRGIELDPATRSVRFARDGMCIDLGGFAKGHAVDGAAARLKALGIGHAYVSAGGDSRVIGDRRGRPWSVAVRDPRRADGVAALLPLEDCAVSTSGDYERFFERAGVRHHHLIDPATGRSPRAVHSVTVIADDGLTAEALSKTLFVLGLERGMAALAQVPGADAVVIDAQGRLHFSPGLQAR
ncbi:FAD:protein FMN transferase [Rubrivivax albus]|uniref:FAD:protein FMN transferase n=1 Tax=Rubrivivax albus TaxID=2499835 RepID=A0A3S2U1I2_9BURK|nr:FAD:protein FMN transferase [Rubrivivax albus]RVT50023.1 FAD:protein FMN transferase [Rubrivivax albus]